MNNTKHIWDRHLNFAVAILFLVLGLAVYAPSLDHAFIVYDDPQLLSADEQLADFSLVRSLSRFTEILRVPYAPLAELTYEMNFAFGGSDPWGYHMTNLLLHIICALSVYIFIRQLLRSDVIALLTGLLFLLHPLNAQVVLWASARKDLLAGIAVLWSLIFYIRWRQHASIDLYWSSLIVFIIGIFAKGTVVLVPLLLFAIDRLHKRPISLRTLSEKTPFLLPAVIIGCIHIHSMQVDVSELIAYMLMGAKAVSMQLQHLLLPTNIPLTFLFEDTVSWNQLQFLFPFLILICLLAVSALSRDEFPIFSFGIHFFVISMLPIFLQSHTTGQEFIAPDRYAYIACIGLFLLCGRGFSALYQKPHLQKILTGFAIAVLLFCAVLSHMQGKKWNNPSISQYLNEVH